MATATNNATTGELINVSYPSGLGNAGNATSLSAIARHGTGMISGLTWAGPGGTLATDAVTRSQSGRVTDETIDGTDADAANPNFIYDPLGRLTKARVAIGGATHVLDYGFATSGGCGAQDAPGRNSNRSSVTDTVGGSPTTTGYCYDNADRLTSSTDTAVGTPAYDSHGNTTTLGTQSLVYDGAGRHMETKVAGTTLVRYERDATGRITSRKEGTDPAVHYGFGGGGDSPSFVMDANNNVIEATMGLLDDTSLHVMSLDFDVYVTDTHGHRRHASHSHYPYTSKSGVNGDSTLYIFYGTIGAGNPKGKHVGQYHSGRHWYTLEAATR